MMAESFTTPNPYVDALRANQREREYSQRLAQQSMTPDQGQMVSGHYVAPSTFQGLNKLVDRYYGEKGIIDSDAEEARIGDERSAAMIRALKGGSSSMIENPDTMMAGYAQAERERQAAALREFQSSQAAAQREFLATQQAGAQGFQGEQKEADRAAALARAQLTAGTANSPMAVRETQWFLSQTPEIQAQHLAVKRANPYVDLGGTKVLTSQTNPGEILDEQTVTLKPGEQPATKEAQAAATARGTEAGKWTAETIQSYPRGRMEAEKSLEVVEKLLNHEGFSGAVGAKGASSLFGILDKPMGGTDARGAHNLWERVLGQNFMQAYQGLKGGGVITEVEGTKATSALTAMQTSSSEKEFREQAKIFVAETKKGMELARQQYEKAISGAQASRPTDSASIMLAADEILKPR